MNKSLIAFAVAFAAFGAQAQNINDCVMPLGKTNAKGWKANKPVPIYATSTSTEVKTTISAMETFYVQAFTNGKVQLRYAPGFAGDQPKAGQVIGWANPMDLELQKPISCD